MDRKQRRTTAVVLLIACSAAYAAAQALNLKTVPYLGKEEPYFLGNGVAGAGGDTHGKWDFLIGPDYTSPNFISSENIGLMIDGSPIALVPQMYRARDTGVFVGQTSIGDLDVWIYDFASQGSFSATRLIRCVNRSRRRTVTVSAAAEIAAGKDIVGDSEDGALRLLAPKNIFCFGDETKNWADRTSTILFSEPTIVSKTTDRWELKTVDHRLAPGQTLSIALEHRQSYTTPGSERGPSGDPERDLNRCIANWKAWMRIGRGALSKVTEPRARDAIEGSLVACKMEQNRDGGTIAGVRKYANSYVRDTHGGVRLFLATAHYAEAKKAIETIHHKWSIAGFIPNYWSMGSDSFLGRSFTNDSSEITGYYVLMIRDYLARTRDLPFVKTLDKSIQFAIDSQLDSLEKNGWRITFNGDETEQYCVRVDGQVYGGFPAFREWHSDSWSFPSAAIAVASIQFYVDYLNAIGKRDVAASYAEKLAKVRKGIDTTFWRSDVTYPHHVWARLKDGTWPKTSVPNYDLVPLWVGARLNGGAQRADAVSAKAEVIPSNGMLPTAPPEVLGYCGHNLGYLLYDLSELHDPMANDVEHTILASGLIGCWGTVSEFYGPQGTPNGHNYRVFESGIIAEALLKFFSR